MDPRSTRRRSASRRTYQATKYELAAGTDATEAAVSVCGAARQPDAIPSGIGEALQADTLQPKKERRRWLAL